MSCRAEYKILQKRIECIEGQDKTRRDEIRQARKVKDMSKRLYRERLYRARVDKIMQV